jgi:hypothetical protein
VLLALGVQLRVDFMCSRDAVGVLSTDMRARVREDGEYFGLAGLVTAVDEMDAAAVASAAAKDEKRVVEAIAAEERAAKRHAARKYEYKHGPYWIGPMDQMTEEQAAEKRAAGASQKRWLESNANLGYRVAHFAVDAAGEYADIMLEKVSAN